MFTKIMRYYILLYVCKRARARTVTQALTLFIYVATCFILQSSHQHRRLTKFTWNLYYYIMFASATRTVSARHNIVKTGNKFPFSRYVIQRSLFVFIHNQRLYLSFGNS